MVNILLSRVLLTSAKNGFFFSIQNSLDLFIYLAHELSFFFFTSTLSKPIGLVSFRSMFLLFFEVSSTISLPFSRTSPQPAYIGLYFFSKSRLFSLQFATIFSYFLINRFYSFLSHRKNIEQYCLYKTL